MNVHRNESCPRTKGIFLKILVVTRDSTVTKRYQQREKSKEYGSWKKSNDLSQEKNLKKSVVQKQTTANACREKNKNSIIKYILNFKP